LFSLALTRERRPVAHMAAALRWWALSDRQWWASPELVVEVAAPDATAAAAAAAGLNKEEREGVRVAVVASVAVALDK
jgi:hypothetical protein